MKKISLLLLVLFVSLNSKGQSNTDFIKKSISKIGQYKTIRHNSLQKWGNVGDVNNYSSFAGLAIFKVDRSDTIIGAQYNLTANDISDIYNDNKLLRLNKKEQSFEESAIKYTDERNNNVISKMLYTGSVMEIYNTLSNVLKKKDYKRVLITDSIYKQKKVKNVKIIYADTVIDGRHLSYQKKILIDKSNYLPLYDVSTSISEYGTQIIECELSNYKLDLSSDIQFFKSVIIPDRYRAYQDLPVKVIKKLEIDQLAPKLELPTIQGGKQSIMQNAGKVILLEFSGVHCGFCLVAVKDLIRIRDKYNLEILSVYSDASHEELKKYIERYKINYPLLFNNGKEKADVLSDFGVSGIPHFMIIGKDGKIKYNQVGYSTDLYDVLSAEIERYLN